MMKPMKRILCVVLTSIMILAMTACGGKEQTAILTFEQDGISMEYQIDAKGDVIQKLTQTSSIDCTGYSEDDIALIEASTAEFETVYNAYEGVTYTSETKDNSIIETIVLDVSDEKLVQSLSEAGLLPIEGDGTKLSLEKTVENLTSQGWTLKTEE